MARNQKIRPKHRQMSSEELGAAIESLMNRQDDRGEAMRAALRGMGIDPNTVAALRVSEAIEGEIDNGSN